MQFQKQVNLWFFIVWQITMLMVDITQSQEKIDRKFLLLRMCTGTYLIYPFMQNLASTRDDIDHHSIKHRYFANFLDLLTHNIFFRF